MMNRKKMMNRLMAVMLGAALSAGAATAFAFEEKTETRTVEIQPSVPAAPAHSMERRAKKSRTVVDEAGQAKTEETYEEQTVQQAAPPPPPPVVEQRSVEEYHTED